MGGHVTTKTYLALTLGVLFVVLSVVLVVLVDGTMKQLALTDAKHAAGMLLDHNLAVHTYFTKDLKPKLFEKLGPTSSKEYFEPTWMSSTYAIRQMDKYFRHLSGSRYYYKESAINARSPENEADAYENTFLADLQKDPQLTTKTAIRHFDGKPYFTVLRRGEAMEESCLRCHSEPEKAPGDMVRLYGPERSFHRKPDEVVQAISIRIPLSEAFSSATRFTYLLSSLLLAVLGGGFLFVWTGSKRLLIDPIGRIRQHAVRIATKPEFLGETIPEPKAKELSDLVAAFNQMSVALKKSYDELEQRVAERTHESAMQRERLEVTLRSIGDGVISTDTEGRVTALNRQAEELTGWTEATALGRPVQEVFVIVNEESRQVSENPVEKVLKTGQIVGLANSTVLIARDGTERILADSGAPIQGKDGKVLGVVLVFRDVTDHVRSEKALKKSEELQRSIVASSPLAVFSIDPNGVVLTWNPSAERILGWPADDVIGQPLPIVPLDKQGEFADLRRRVMSGEKFSGQEVSRQKKDGSLFHAGLSAAPIHDDHGNIVAIMSTIEDVTQRKEAEEKLEKERAKLKSILDNMPDGVYIANDRYQIEYLNPKLESTFGPVSNRLCYQYFHDRTDPCPWCEHYRVFDGESVQREWYSEKVGRTYELFTTPLINDDGSISKLEFFHDITDRKKAELALRESELRYSTFLNSTTDLAFLKDEDFRYVMVNKAHQEFFGKPEAEIIGKTDLDLMPPDVAKNCRASDLQAMQNDGTVLTEEAVGSRVFETKKFVVKLENGQKRIGGLIREVTERKQADKALRETQDKFKHVFESANVGKSIALPSGEIQLNKAFCDMLGYTQEELRNKTWRDVTAPEDVETTEEFIGRLLRGEMDSVRFNKRYVHKKGSYIWADVSVALVHDYDGKALYFITTVVDITERIAAEKQIRMNEARLQSLYDIGQYKAVNTQDLLDFALNEAIKLTGSTVGYIYHYDEEKRLFELNTWSKDVMKECEVAEPQTLYELDKTGIWGEAIRQRKPIIVNDFQAPNPLKKGYPQGHVELRNFMTIPLFSGDRIVAVVGAGNKDSEYDESDVRQLTVLMDAVWRIAEAKRNEGKHRRLVTAVEQAVEGIVITDTQGNIEYVNPAYESITGYSKHEVIGRQPTLFRSGEKDSPMRRAIIEALSRGEKWSGHLVKERKDGGIYEEDVTVTPVLDSQGEIVNYVAVKRDVTHEAGLRRQLLQAQKMEAIGTLAGGIAHDFNNILQVALGYSELLLGDESLPQACCSDLRKVYDSAKRGADLVQRLLTFSRKTETKPQPLNLNRRITEIRKMLERTVPKMIDIRLVLDEGLATINADPTQIDQILMNLAVNARDAMPDGGKLTIQTANVLLDEEYARGHLELHSGLHVLLAVTDTGTGIDAKTLEHIFEPFYTTKGVGEGTGLGLAMVHGVVKHHGGHITCYSEPGRGTTFRMYFPALVTDAESEEAAVRAMPAGGSETILLVDDEEFLRDFGSRILNRAGYKVITACNGREALEAYESGRGEIDLVVLDLIMPEMGGRQCLEGLLRLDPAAKVVIASGYSADAMSSEALVSSAKGFVGKPYDIRRLLEIVREVLDGK